ncbi:DUF3040 domain-containing protein [Qaidamihabitans albus]|uniref:DUF3040 domain-containing protein n=1 Tax=Qaidamihabitans albus TaxID=2795733 RepID=UPI0018F19AD6|nr:DUF3040 domain-containing protein [Qaidamihabitans albus]
MLSQYERRELDRIEQRFEADDPLLAQELGHGVLSRKGPLSWLARAGLDVLAGAAVLLGLVTLDFGLVFLGAMTLAVAAWLHVRSGASRGDARRDPSAADAQRGPDHRPE